jgi:hypothetical protein
MLLSAMLLLRVAACQRFLYDDVASHSAEPKFFIRIDRMQAKLILLPRSKC